MATIEARIVKVEHDVGTGWYTISTDNNSVKRLTTKMEPKAREAAALRQSGEVALIRYSHKQRHDESSGRTYNNYYYEQAATAPSGGGASNGDGGIDSIGGIDTAQGRSTYRPTDPKDAWRMAKSTGAKLAVETLPLMPQEQRDFPTQKQIALAWADWIFQDDGPPSASSESGFAQRSSGAPGAYAEPDAASGYGYDAPPTDDDIPF